MPIFSADELRHVAQAILQGVGTPEENARLVSASLVESNLVGHDSHGVMRLMSYVEFARRGQVKPEARPFVAKRERATAQVDGAWGWGHISARLATTTVTELAAEYGVAATTIDHCNHVGRLGEYVEMMAHAGMIGIALCNVDPAVAPFGGVGRVMGTNPLAWAVPRAGENAPLFSDFATSGVAEGKLRVARAKGERVEPGLIVDSQGRPSQEPADFYNGGALLPFGGHKGYGLSVMVELLGGVLSGMAASVQPEYKAANGTLFLALNIAAFMPVEQFTQQVENFCARVKATPPADGFSEVLLPGDPERRTRAQRLVEGISLPEQTWREIQALARELNVPT